MTSAPRLRVMHSHVDASNPFFSLLTGAMPADVETLRFSWRAALTGGCDVLHVHWPERLIRDVTRRGTLRKQVLTLAMLVAFALRRTPIVRTLHNSTPHDRPTRTERVLLRLLDRSTTVWVRLTDATTPPQPGPVHTILHGDYAGHYAFDPASVPLPDRLLYFGRIRAYKGVESLVETVAGTPDLPFHLRLAGRPTTPALRTHLEDAVRAAPAVSARLEFVPEDDLVPEIEQARAVCLPYQDMENSGAMLLALTAGRPVIVPDTAPNALLAAELGERWVVRYQPPLDAERLLAAWIRATSTPASARPDLSARSWPALSGRYVAVYDEAIARRGRGRRPGRSA